MKRTVGIDCPGCGMTRAFISISHGEWRRAIQFNPASFLLYAFLIVQLPYRLIQVVRIQRGEAAFSDGWSLWFVLALGVILVVQWIVRIAIPGVYLGLG